MCCVFLISFVFGDIFDVGSRDSEVWGSGGRDRHEGKFSIKLKFLITFIDTLARISTEHINT